MSIPPMMCIRGFSPAIAHLPRTNAIIVAGGGYQGAFLSSTERLDLTTMTWSLQPGMHIARCSTAGVCLTDGTTFLVCGGNNDNVLPSCEKFDSTTNTWSPVADMLAFRKQHSIVLYRGIPIVLGGVYLTDLNTCEQYDSDKWVPFPSFNVPRRDFGAAVVLDKIYITGGGGRPVQMSSVEVYDGASWSILSTELPYGPRSGHAALCFQDKLVVLGGDHSEIDVYDPIDKTWINSLDPLPVVIMQNLVAVVF